jgi:predicted lipid carrier protein YhbT
MKQPPAASRGYTLPGIVTRLGAMLPQWPHSVALCTALNAAASMRLLPEDPLAYLEGRTFVVQVADAGSEAAFTCRGRIFRPIPAPETPDLLFRANVSAYLKLLRREEDPDTLFFRRELAIVGDTELSLIVKNMLDAIDLPRMGDLTALIKTPSRKSAGQP